MKNAFDVAVIGGGASGLACAVSIKRKNKNTSVCVFEQLQRVGKKLITTGNGRCNITNKNIDISRYHSSNKDFPVYALSNYNALLTKDFFSSIGILFTFEGDKAYPYSLQASSVVDGLRFSCEEMGIDIKTESKVTDILHKGNLYEITANGEIYVSKSVVVASGLFSGGEKLGSNGSILKLLSQKGYKTVKTTPAIVQLKTENSVTRSLKGIKVVADVSLLLDGKKIRSDSGEVLFCDYGLSGPPIMQISREISRQKGKFSVLLDIMPEYTFSELLDIIINRIENLKSRSLDEFFTGMLNKRVGQQIIKLCGKNLSESVSVLQTGDVKQIANMIKNWKFDVIGTTGFDNSQVTAGGLDTNGFDSKTMMSKSDKGLFAIGEILDVDGDCGGFNLQWAWSSAFCACDGILNYLGKKDDNNK